VIFQSDFIHYKLFNEPFLNGAVDTQRVNDAVSRVLKAKFELGLFEDPYVSEDAIKALMKDHSHKAIAKQAALESIVLLKNEKQTLPLSKNTKTIALIGEEITAGRLGGYSGNGNGVINMLDGINKNSPKILYAKGAE
jgi:beta-glucosidase